MLRLPPIELRSARSAREAARILAAEGGDARVVAGGTDLWPNLKRRHQHAPVVVSLMGIPTLRRIRHGRGELRIGATARLSEMVRDRHLRERYPALCRAVSSIASPPLRNMGTIGGNLCVDTRCTYYNQTEEWRRSIDYCLKEAGEVCWVATKTVRCWAHSASDSAPMLCALDARVRLVSPEGERIIPIEELYRDDGVEYLSRHPDEIVTEVLLPAGSDAWRCRATYWKLRRRGSIDFPVLSVAAAVWPDAGGVIRRAALWLGAVGSCPLRVTGAEAALGDRPLEPEIIDHAARLARRVATPFDNTDFTPAWRGRMVERYARAALRELAGLDPECAPPKQHLTLA